MDYKEISELRENIKKFTDTKLYALIDKDSCTLNDFVEKIRSDIFLRTGEITTSMHDHIKNVIYEIILKEIARRWVLLKEAIE